MKYVVKHLMEMTHNERNRTQHAMWLLADSACAFVLFFNVSALLSRSNRISMASAVCFILVSLAFLTHHREKQP